MYSDEYIVAPNLEEENIIHWVWQSGVRKKSRLQRYSNLGLSNCEVSVLPLHHTARMW